jgi:hypothetical protein
MDVMKRFKCGIIINFTTKKAALFISQYTFLFDDTKNMHFAFEDGMPGRGVISLYSYYTRLLIDKKRVKTRGIKKGKRNTSLVWGCHYITCVCLYVCMCLMIVM